MYSLKHDHKYTIHTVYKRKNKTTRESRACLPVIGTFTLAECHGNANLNDYNTISKLSNSLFCIWTVWMDYISHNPPLPSAYVSGLTNVLLYNKHFSQLRPVDRRQHTACVNQFWVWTEDCRWHSYCTSCASGQLVTNTADSDCVVDIGVCCR